MTIRFNAAFAALILLYGIPGLFIAESVPFLEEYFGRQEIWPLACAGFLQAALAYGLFPRTRLTAPPALSEKYKSSVAAVLCIRIAYLSCASFVFFVELSNLRNIAGLSDRTSLYQAYLAISSQYPLEKLKSFIAVASVYFMLSGERKFSLLICFSICAVDFCYGNRGFVFYTLIIVFFCTQALSRAWSLSIIASGIILLLARTYIFSGDSVIEGYDHLLAVFGEFIFTSSTPLLVSDLGKSGDVATMIVQMLGLDKISGRTAWVGEIIQERLDLPIGLACGPLCEVRFYVGSEILSLCTAASAVVLVYAAVLKWSATSVRREQRFPIVIVQALLMRDVVRTGLILSLSTLILWTIIALAMNRAFFCVKKHDSSGTAAT